MARLELIGCRLAIQMNVWCFPNGRARRRTVTLRNVRPDASADQLEMVVRALEKVIAHPIIRVRVVKKYILVADGGEARQVAHKTTGKLPARGGEAPLEPCPRLRARCAAPCVGEIHGFERWRQKATEMLANILALAEEEKRKRHGRKVFAGNYAGHILGRSHLTIYDICIICLAEGLL